MASIYSQMPSWTDAGLHATLSFNTSLLYLGEVTGYNMTAEQVKAILQPWTSTLDNLSIPYFASFTDSPSYRQHWHASVTDGPVGTYWQTGGQADSTPSSLSSRPNLTTYMAVLRYLG